MTTNVLTMFLTTMMVTPTPAALRWLTKPDAEAMEAMLATVSELVWPTKTMTATVVDDELESTTSSVGAPSSVAMAAWSKTIS
jgi:K+-transporting ATPase A subunit